MERAIQCAHCGSLVAQVSNSCPQCGSSSSGEVNLSSPPDPDSPVARIARRLFAPVDIAPLVWFRIAFGIIMAWEMWRYFEHGWIYDYYIQPKFFFTYYGFSWVHPWPGNGMYVHFAVLGVLAACIALGLCYRAATVLFFLGFTYVFLLDQTDYLNHFYLVCLYSFLLTVVPANRAFSLDAGLLRICVGPPCRHGPSG